MSKLYKKLIGPLVSLFFLLNMINNLITGAKKWTKNN